MPSIIIYAEIIRNETSLSNYKNFILTDEIISKYTRKYSVFTAEMIKYFNFFDSNKKITLNDKQYNELNG